MASLSLPAKLGPSPSPLAVNLSHDDLNNEMIVLWKQEISARLHGALCSRSSQPKLSLVRRSRNGKNGSFEMFMKSCISKAAMFSSSKLRAFLRSFSVSSVEGTASRCSASSRSAGVIGGTSFTDGTRNNNGGDGCSGGGGSNGGDGCSGGGGGGRDSPGGSGGGNNANGNPVVGVDWWWWWQNHAPRGKVFVAVSEGIHMVHPCGYQSDGFWLAERLMQAAVAPLLIHFGEPALEAMMQILITPFMLLFLIPVFCSSDFASSMYLVLISVFVAGPIIVVVLLWLLWKWMRGDRSQGVCDEDYEENEDGDSS